MRIVFYDMQLFLRPGGPERAGRLNGHRAVAEHCAQQTFVRVQNAQSGEHVQAECGHHHSGAIDVCADDQQKHPTRSNWQNVEIDTARTDQRSQTQEHNENQALCRVETASVECHGSMAWRQDVFQERPRPPPLIWPKTHEMVLGTMADLKAHAAEMRKMPGMKHAEPNMITLAAGKIGGLVWTLSQPGAVDFACLVPGHMEAGMVGKVIVS